MTLFTEGRLQAYDIPEEDDYEEDETDSADSDDEYSEAFSPDGEE